MDSKSKLHGSNNMHSAGIYSDMSVDGPKIGTLVLIVDRAKNLPNRKYIGKQNPYCAARLGKEAKKTDTDHRGGQTPKWDQELRYTVHDSPDYYQLKVSVFNDDKKTDLIGETWINLKDVIILGGGQNDIWHTLNYKGKYAGEIRIEITFYDTRHQKESPVINMSNRANNHNSKLDSNESQIRHRQRHSKKLIKYRPLPLDPVPRNGSADTCGSTNENSNSVSFQTLASRTPETLGTPSSSYSSRSCNSRVHDKRSSRGHRSSTLMTSSDSSNMNSKKGHRGSKSISTKLLSPIPITPDYSNPNSFEGHRSSLSFSAESAASLITAPDYSGKISRKGHRSTISVSTKLADPLIEHSRNICNQYSIGLSDCKHKLYEDLYGCYLNKNSSSQLPQNNQFNNPDRQRYIFANEEYTFRKDQFTPRNIPNDSLYNKPAIQADGISQHPDETPPPPPIHRSRNLSQSPMHESISPRQDTPSRTPDHSPTYVTSYINDPFIPSNTCKRRASYTSRLRDEYNGNYQSDPHNNYQESSHNNQMVTTRNHDSGFIQNTIEYASISPSTRGYQIRGRIDEQEIKDKDRSHLTKPLRQHTELQIYELPADNNLSSNLHRIYHEGQSESPFPFSASENTVNNRSAQYLDSARSVSGPSIHQDVPFTPCSTSLSRNRHNRRLSTVPKNLIPGNSQHMPEDLGNKTSQENRVGRDNICHKIHEERTPHHNIPIHTLPYRQSILAYSEHHGRYSDNNRPTSSDSHASNIRIDFRIPPARKSVSPSSNRPENKRRNSYVPYGPKYYNTLNPNINSTCNSSLSFPYDRKSSANTKIITYDGREIDPIDHIPESNYAPLYETKSSKYVTQISGQSQEQITNTQNYSPSAGPRPPKHSSRPPSSHKMGRKIVTYQNNNSMESLPPDHLPWNMQRRNSDVSLGFSSNNFKHLYNDPNIAQPKPITNFSLKVRPNLPKSNTSISEEYNPTRYELQCSHYRNKSTDMLPMALTTAYRPSQTVCQGFEERRGLY